MANTLVFLGTTPANPNQLYTVSSASGVGGAAPSDLTGYAEGNAGPTDLTTLGSNQVFAGGTATDRTLWSLDGGTGAATQITDNSLSPDLDPRNLTAAGGTLFFSGNDASNHGNLYTSNGAAGGAHAIAVSDAGGNGLTPDEIVAANSRVFFSGIDAAGSNGLWTSDGTTAGTIELAVANTDTQNVSNLGAGLNPSNITVANGQIFFAGTDGSGALGLWKSDGTGAGTIEIKPAAASQNGVAPTTSNIVAFNGLTYFAGHDASGNVGLWSTDGTGADTVELNVGNSSVNGLGPVSLTVMNGALYFGGTDASGSTGLWKSDGTAAGTTELKVAGAAAGGLNPISLNASDYPNTSMAVFGNRLYFAGNGADGTQDLWSSDGTAAGTAQVGTSDAAGTGTGVTPTDFAVIGNAGASGTSGGGGNPGTIASAVAPLTIGSGHDTITFVASEDAYQGDAQYTILVDGKQIGGSLTETAQRSSSQAQTITVNGDFGDGPHTLSLDFLNDAYGGSTAADRNLYASSFTYDGTSVPGSLTLLKTGAQTVTMGTSAPGTTILGSGSDSVTLQMSEDMFLGDAQFVVSVDGTQIGGTQTVVASHGAGQSQQFNVLGNFGAGAHTVAVTFTNDAAGATPLQDRNLYVNSTSYDGTLVAGGSLTEMAGGTQNVIVNAPPDVIPPVLTVGSGLDTISLKVSEDSYLGDAKFTVSVDGTQVGGTLTAQDAHSAGLDQTLNVLGNFGAGAHQVTVNFLNDATAGSIAAGDRNLYVDGASYDGTVAPGAILALMSSGPQTLSVGTPVSSNTTWIGTGYDMIGLNLSEDFYLGNAQFTVSVDGAQVGGTQTASALHSAGQEQTLDLFGSFGAGRHTVTVNFLNDAYGGSASADRNLYLDKASYNNATPSSTGLALMGQGAQSIVVGTAQQSVVTLGSGTDTIALKVSEDYFQGDAQFTLTVDGKQISGTQTASAQHAAGQDTTYNLVGNFGAGQHTIGVTFLNDDSGPNIATQDRNLYVDGASYDGTVVAGGTLSVLSNETETMTVGKANQGTVYLGSGMDTVSLQVSEDFYQGDAQFTISVDGTQIGGIQTAAAQHGAKQDQTFNLSGNFGAGQHKVAVNFLNDAYDGSAATDRNLYIDSASYDGAATAGASLALMAGGTQSVAVGNPAPAVTTIGSGQDIVGLKVSEDFYEGDARFTVSVDGRQVGSVQTAGAQHNAGQDATLNVLGNFGPGSHVVSLDFLNDWNGPTGDRNLYIDGTTFDSKAVANGSIAIPAAVPGSIAVPGADTLTLHMSEDAYAGDAQYNVYVDGKQIGGTMTATAFHGTGQTQAVTLAGSWGAGTHSVGVAFLNDAYGGSPNLNRNLYVDSIGLNGSDTAENFELGVNGGTNFNITTATTYTPGAVGGTIATLGNDTVNAGTGFITVGADGPTTLVNGGSGGMQFFGNTGSGTVVGGSGTSNVIDSGGSLAFTAGTGAATISAGFSHELYTIVNGQAGSSLDLYGFNPANDHVHLQGYSGSGIALQQVTGGSTTITLTDSTKIVLHGVTQLSNQQIFV